MVEISSEDYQAALDLASEMNVYDACRFLRTELGISLMGAVYAAEKSAADRPDSALARSLAERRSSLPMDQMRYAG